MELIKGRLNFIIDGQFGSTGKGLFAGYIAKQNDLIDYAVTNAAPNAGHTYIDDDQHFVCYHLPVAGVLHKESIIYITAGAIVDPEILEKEIEDYGVERYRVKIHPHAAVIDFLDKKNEHFPDSAVAKIASTQKGCGMALARKVSRSAKLAKDTPALQKYVQEINLNQRLQSGATAFMEIPQGVSLGLNSGFYPYVTSREVSIGQGFSDAQVSPALLGNVALTLRTYPIRVGNLISPSGDVLGTSGPWYEDQDETTWEAIGVPPELTTVTKRVRRVANFSLLQYRKSLDLCRPDAVFLNFVNYFKNRTEAQALLDCMDVIEGVAKCKPTRFFGTGPTLNDVIPEANVNVAGWEILNL